MGVAGKYDLTIGEGQNARTSTLELVPRDSGIEGTLVGESGTTVLNGVESTPHDFELRGKAKRGLMRVNMCLTGSVTGDCVAGQLDLGKLGSLPFEGVRSPG